MSLRDRIHEDDAEAPLGSAILASGAPAVDAGPVRIPVERYTSPDFFRRELSMLWPRVWLIACSVDHVAERGDFYEARFGPYSVVIVRGDDGELRAELERIEDRYKRALADLDNWAGSALPHAAE